MKSSYRQPAEWMPHRACWLAYPYKPEEWGDALAPAQEEFLELCRAIADLDASGRPRGEHLCILVPDDSLHETLARALPSDAFTAYSLPYDDSWLRDSAPIFVADEGQRLAAACFRFNAWGGKFDMPEDARLAPRIAAQAGAEPCRWELTLEGGAIEVDGEGSALTTRSCLLAAERNPGWDEAGIEALLRQALGIEGLIWLDTGLQNDHTDGHIDNLARFAAPGRVLCTFSDDPGDPNYEVHAAIQRTLRDARDARGRSLELIALPSAGELRGSDGELMPASYCNFYIGNSAVVVPCFGLPSDQPALDVLEKVFPDRKVVGRSARALLCGGDTFHCLTQQEPAIP